MKALVSVSLLSLLLATACGGGSHRATVTYAVELDEGDVTGALLASDTHVGPADAQWNALLADANRELGRAPERFEVTGVRLQLDATRSQNVGGLEQAFSGQGALFLRQEAGAAQVDIATFEGLRGSAQVEVDATGSALTPVQADLLRGDFRLGLRGATTRSAAEDFKATVLVTLEVEAN